MIIKIKVGVFFGGKSVEHEISVISALQAISSLDLEKYDVIPVYITKSGEMYTGKDIGKIEEYKDIPSLLKKSVRINLMNDNGKILLIRYPQSLLSKKEYAQIDVALPVVHGTNVEDGTLQGYLKFLSCPFVGCDVLSSALGMDKYAAKVIMKASGLPVLDCVVIKDKDFAKNSDKAVELIEKNTRYPVIVKPVNLGSSVGIKKASDKQSLLAALEYAFQFSQRVLIENAVVSMREINCSVLGDKDSAKASVCEEPINHDEILSYADKYLSGGGKTDGKASGGTKSSAGAGSAGMADTKRKLPAELSEETTKRIQGLAVDAFLSLGCSGVSRVDFLIDCETDDIYINEINTIPGSLSFYLWEASGISFSELLDKLIALALKRERENADINFSFDTNILSGITIPSGTKGK